MSLGVGGSELVDDPCRLQPVGAAFCEVFAGFVLLVELGDEIHEVFTVGASGQVWAGGGDGSKESDSESGLHVELSWVG